MEKKREIRKKKGEKEEKEKRKIRKKIRKNDRQHRKLLNLTEKSILNELCSKQLKTYTVQSIIVTLSLFVTLDVQVGRN